MFGATMPRRVFISHAAVNADVAVRICEGLEASGLPCWIAPRDVRFDGTYGSEILKGLRECDVFLLVVTEPANHSQQVEREAERASFYKKRIIPVVVDGTEVGPALEFYVAGRQRYPLASSVDDQALARLVDAIRHGPTLETSSLPLVAPQRRQRVPPWMIGVAAGIVAAAGVTMYLLPDRDPATTGHAPAPGPSRPVASSPDESIRGTDNPTGRGTVNPTGVVTMNSTGAGTMNPTGGGTRITSGGNPPTSGGVPPREGGNPPREGGNPPREGGAPSSSLVAGAATLRFVTLPAGRFRMGCSAGDAECRDDERPARPAVVDEFQMSATEVTQQFWQSVMGSNPSDFSGQDLPVHNVSWNDAQAFLDRLNQRRDGFSYRLPTEAEWEYAARAGDAAAGPLSAVAWFGLAESSGRSSRPQAVGTKARNGWGLHDMLGNVAEWCEDWFSPNFQRVVRGGSWQDGPASLRLSARDGKVPGTRDYSIGVRVVRQPAAQ